MEDSCERLCSTHFCGDLETRVRSYMEFPGRVSPRDHIAVALSGGKDSSALLLLLHGFQPAWPDVELTAVTVDEGIGGYREETMDAASDLAATLGVRHEIVAFTDLFGKTLDTMVKGRENRACTICGVMRRNALIHAARRIGATKIATGHNRDDEAQSVLMNVFRGDLPRLLQDSSSGGQGCFLPRIKPLSVVSEREILTYLLVRGFYRDLPECPYSSSALRSTVRVLLENFEERFPGTSENLVMLRGSLRQSLPRSVAERGLRPCRECGESSSGEICQTCRIQHLLQD
ncbi:MAG: tRNA 2-thiocytidine biosynthesis protein TtcA [Methanoregulaceae archaeon PtaB.Bin108]|nr:MAG: tRNA 2-thiocytidine biosynthesis protein TtcA [Methanoregulaceae archaeon PtaB.Bin108]